MLWTLSIVAIFLGARVLAARALHIRPWLLPRTGTLGQRAIVALSGPLACALTLLLGSFLVHLFWGVPHRPPCVTSVRSESPAAAAGLAARDCIIAVDGRAVATAADVALRVAATGGRPFPIELERDGVRQTVKLTARSDDGRHRIGVQFDGSPRFARVGLRESLKESIRFVGEMSAGYANSLVSAISARQPTVEVVGPVGVVRMARQAVSLPHLYLAAIGSQFLLAAVFGLLLSIGLLLAARSAP